MIDQVNFYVYILTNRSHTVLYTGLTDELERRVFEHKNKLFPNSFTARYNCHKLVYFEEFIDKEEASLREKQLKKYRRSWKEDLIDSTNPNWRDLYFDFIE